MNLIPGKLYKVKRRMHSVFDYTDIIRKNIIIMHLEHFAIKVSMDSDTDVYSFLYKNTKIFLYKENLTNLEEIKNFYA